MHFCILAQEAAAPVQRSLLAWMFQALGPFYGLVIPVLGFVIFVGACVVVAMSRRPAVIAAYLVFLPLPFLVGLLGTVQGIIASYSMIATSMTAPKPSELAQGVSMAMFSTLVGLLATFPSYFVLAFGLFLRTVAAGRSQPGN